MNEKLTLYRGDFTKISRFKFAKCFKDCFAGKGIYLTNDLSLAESYRTKGSNKSLFGNTPNQRVITSVLSERMCRDRNEAYEWAFHVWLSNTLNKNITIDDANVPKYKNYYTQYRNLISDGVIITEKENARYYSKERGEYLVRFKVIDKSIQNVTNSVGYITEFLFDKNYFENNIIDISKNCTDIGFLEAVYDCRQVEYFFSNYVSLVCENDNSSLYSIEENRDLFIQAMSNPAKFFNGSRAWIYNTINKPTWSDSFSKYWSSDRHHKVFTKLRNRLSEYGVLGFEYAGGVHTGSQRHRAFVIWDEDYVNSHIVARRK